MPEKSIESPIITIWGGGVKYIFLIQETLSDHSLQLYIIYSNFTVLIPALYQLFLVYTSYSRFHLYTSYSRFIPCIPALYQLCLVYTSNFIFIPVIPALYQLFQVSSLHQLFQFYTMYSSFILVIS